MEKGELSRSERFLQRYRVLEGLLEKRSGKRSGGSVVMDYLRDEDSEPYRYALNVCREIRNLLSHNADAEGEPIVEPSESILATLEEILCYVAQPRYAVDYGTPREKILCAHPNDSAIETMHRMNRLGFSHVPVLDRGRLTGVFSPGSLFAYLERNGLDALDEGAKIGRLKEALQPENHGSERYLFMPKDATILQVRAAFENRSVRNSRLSAVFITQTGACDEPLIAMLTPWDVLKEPVIAKSKEADCHGAEQ